MLHWSNIKYKFTLGIGALAIAGMMSELWQREVSLWLVLGIAMWPLILFVLVEPGDLPWRLVRFAHVVASLHYLTVIVVLLTLYLDQQPVPRGWPVYLFCSIAGTVPCGLVIFRWIIYGYRPDEPEDATAKCDE